MRPLVSGVLVCLLGILAACSSLVSFGTAGQIVISRFPEKGELFRIPLGPEKQFSLSFIHSVSKTEVIDVYEIRGREIIQTREIFSAHGAGLPSSPEEPGGLFWEQKDQHFVLHMERPMPRLVVRTDKNYKNRLTVQGRTVNLNQWEDQALLLTTE
ncbi:DUF1850 domain-containing protein [Desulfospira joergensenii]|uniref:DUF1850 domain-containing protein n=1 Tax=Desulfospira joergensenii TaxID=53329 RepID=UPI0003B3BDAB|nr:DUF1850 domain-containing protein [Desulfospira joergensenii]